MLPPCFRLAERVFPLVRQDAAARLAASGHSQAEIGRRLGVSQAMVSKYLKNGAPRPQEEDQWIVHQMAQEISQLDVQTPPPDAHSHDTVDNPWCRALALTTGEHQEERRRLVATLLGVLNRLQETHLAALTPAVGINLAGALPHARARSDVAAFPGRLAWVQGTLRAHAPPEFGASNHLASVLIHAQRDAPGVRLVMNLAGTGDVLDAARKSGETLVQGHPKKRDEAGVVRFTAPSVEFALVDPGGFGIEPALYLVDRDAGKVARRLERLAAAAVKTKPGS